MKQLALLVMMLGSSSVLAQPADPPKPPDDAGKPGDPAPSGDAKAEAKKHYEAGLTHYNLGEWDAAITEFRTAYGLSQAPGLLFNIAQSFRLKKDFEQASYFYKTYLRLKPDAPNRADVEQRIAEMEKSIAEAHAAATAPPVGTVGPDGGKSQGTQPTNGGNDNKGAQPTININMPAQGVKSEPVDHSGDESLQTAGIATGGAGAALLLTGLVFGHLASNNEKALNGLNNGGMWTQARQDQYDAGKRDNTIAIICFVAGGAAVATGATLWGLGYMREHQTSVAVVPTKSGAAFAASFSF